MEKKRATRGGDDYKGTIDGNKRKISRGRAKKERLCRQITSTPIRVKQKRGTRKPHGGEKEEALSANVKKSDMP